METLVAVGLVLLGLALLAGGGEALVRGATTLAEIAGVTPAVIGLTVVAIGTSLPELVVSVLAAIRGQPDIAVANVVGSNIFNVALILGVTALLLPLPVHGTAVRLEWPVMFAASVGCLLFSLDGVVGRAEGALFLVALVAFMWWSVRIARRHMTVDETRQATEEAEARDLPSKGRGPLTGALLVLGLAGLVAGGHFLVEGAVTLARLVGMTERVIGLTVVAAGTSAPELATSVMAALRGRTDVAVANIIGSNIFNILGILGTTAVVVSVPVAPALVRSDMVWMIGTAVLLLPLMYSSAKITRWEGGLLLGAFVVYLTLLLRAA